MTSSDHPDPIRRVEEDAEFSGGRQMWYEVICTTSLHTIGRHRGGWSRHVMCSGIRKKYVTTRGNQLCDMVLDHDAGSLYSIIEYE